MSFFDDSLDRHAPTIVPAILSKGSCVNANIDSIYNKGTSKATAVQQGSPRRVRWRDIDGVGDLATVYTTTDKAMLDNLVFALEKNDHGREKKTRQSRQN